MGKAKVWAVFSDETSGEVVMIPTFPDKKTGIVLEAVGIDNIPARNSAVKAIRSAYNILISLGQIENRNYGFSYEFDGHSLTIGESASLAFALKLVEKTIDLSFSIAATGSVPNSTQQAPVNKVEYINEKVKAAASILKSNDVIFIPKKNLPEVSPEIKEIIESKGIHLKAVDSVEDAIVDVLLLNGTLTPEKLKEIKSSPKKPQLGWIAVMLILCLIVLLLIAPKYLDFKTRVHSFYPKIKITYDERSDIENALYSDIKNAIATELNNRQINDTGQGYRDVEILIKNINYPKKSGVYLQAKLFNETGDTSVRSVELLVTEKSEEFKNKIKAISNKFSKKVIDMFYKRYPSPNIKKGTQSN
jgi:hypothetical protein